MQGLVSLVENVCESKFKDALYPTVCQRIPPVSTSTIIIFISAFASWTQEIWSDMKLSLLPSARLLHWKPVLRRLSSTCRIVMVRNYSVTKNNFPNLRVGKKCPFISVYFAFVQAWEKAASIYAKSCIVEFRIALWHFQFSSNSAPLDACLQCSFWSTYGKYLNITWDSVASIIIKKKMLTTTLNLNFHDKVWK